MPLPPGFPAGLGFTLSSGATLFDHAELRGQRFRFEDDRSLYSREYFCSWDDRVSAVRGLLGWSKRETNNNGAFLSRHTPHCIGEGWTAGVDTTTPFLYCDSVEGEPYLPQGIAATTTLPDRDKPPIYMLCRLNAQYRSLPWDVRTDAQMKDSGYTTDGTPNTNPDESTWARNCVVMPRPSGEFFSIPFGAMKWVDGNATPIQQGVGRLNCYANLVVSQLQVDALAVPCLHCNPSLTAPSAIEAALGTVNQVAINNYPAGSLLLTAVDLKPRRSAFGVRTWDVTAYLRYFDPNTDTVSAGGIQVAKGHQFIFRPQKSAYQEVTTTGSTNLVLHTANVSLFGWSDHRAIFRPPA